MPELPLFKRRARLLTWAWVGLFSGALLLGVYLVWFDRLTPLAGAPVDRYDLAKFRYEFLFAYENTPFEFAQGLLLLFVAYFHFLSALRVAGLRRIYFAFFSLFFLFFFLEDMDWLCGFRLHARFIPTMSLALVFGLYLCLEMLIGLWRLWAGKWTALDIVRLTWPLYIWLPNWLIMSANKMSAAQFYISLYALFLAVGGFLVETARPGERRRFGASA